MEIKDEFEQYEELYQITIPNELKNVKQQYQQQQQLLNNFDSMENIKKFHINETQRLTTLQLKIQQMMNIFKLKINQTKSTLYDENKKNLKIVKYIKNIVL